MEKILLLLMCVAAVCAVEATGQTPQVRGESSATAVMGGPMPIAKFDVEIREQPDSPLRLLPLDPKQQGRFPGSPLNLRNESNVAIAAAVIRADGDPAGGNTMMIFGPKGLAVGQTRMFTVAAHHAAKETDKVVAYVDFVQLTDGRTWGADTLRRSRQIKAYIEGQTLALTRLAGLTAGQDNTEIERALSVFGAASYSEPNLPMGRQRPEVDFSARGYEQIIMILRRMGRETERGQDLARQLELAARK